jgi:hypothetical protein
LLETLDEEAGKRMMERLKEFRVEGKLSNRAKNEFSNGIIMHNSVNVEMARDNTDRSYQWVAFRTERHKGKLGKRKIKEFEKEAEIIDMHIKGDKPAAIAKSLRI